MCTKRREREIETRTRKKWITMRGGIHSIRLGGPSIFEVVANIAKNEEQEVGTGDERTRKREGEQSVSE